MFDGDADDRSKWFLPLFSVALGFVMLAAMWIGGNPSRLSARDLTDSAPSSSRRASEPSAACAATDGRALPRSTSTRPHSRHGRPDAIIVAFIVEVARGQDGTPYSWLGAIGGLSYLIALRLRG